MVTLRLPRELLGHVQRRAEQEGRPLRVVVAEALWSYVGERGVPRRRRALRHRGLIPEEASREGLLGSA